MNMNAEDLKRITPEEFEAMPKNDHCKYELIDGIVMMTPSPSFEHQVVGVNLISEFRAALKSTDCRVLYEYDIKFHGDIYKPDLMVFCKNRDAMPPDIIIEILSPSTRRRDLTLKLFKYEAMGIKEYWIVDPKTLTVTVHDFVHGTAEGYTSGEVIQSLAHPEIIVAVNDVFA